MKLFDRISEREKFVVIVIALVLLFCFGIFSCKPKSAYAPTHFRLLACSEC